MDGAQRYDRERCWYWSVEDAATYTIGHSSHTPEHFIELLQRHGIEVLVDVRSAPYSRYSPHFDREPLRDLVTAAAIKYLYLGDAIGGRPKDESHYDLDGHARYAKVAGSPDFLGGILRLERGADEFRVALMCSEEDPTHCHRRLLIGRVLIERGAELPAHPRRRRVAVRGAGRSRFGQAPHRPTTRSVRRTGRG